MSEGGGRNAAGLLSTTTKSLRLALGFASCNFTFYLLLTCAVLSFTRILIDCFIPRCIPAFQHSRRSPVSYPRRVARRCDTARLESSSPVRQIVLIGGTIRPEFRRQPAPRQPSRALLDQYFYGGCPRIARWGGQFSLINAESVGTLEFLNLEISSPESLPTGRLCRAGNAFFSWALALLRYFSSSGSQVMCSCWGIWRRFLSRE